MGEPHVEMSGIHEAFKATGRDQTVRNELKGRWLDAHPDTTAGDYNTFLYNNADAFKSSYELLSSMFDIGLERWKVEEGLRKDALSVDEHKLGLRGKAELFADLHTRQVYSDLAECFKDDVLRGESEDAYYNFDDKAVAAFHDLLADAKLGAERNATELGAELAAAFSANLEALTKPELIDSLYPVLEEFRGALKDWNTLLASDALPDRTKLRNQASECGTRLSKCLLVHGPIVTSGKTTNPFVKYQLLAAMRALGEKVAAQYAARAGKASFTGMHELIADAPNRGSKATEKAKELMGNYNGNLVKAWPAELVKLKHDLVRADKNIAKELDDKFFETSLGVTDALKSWRNYYEDLGKLHGDLEPMRDAVAKIAFGIV